MPLKCCRIHRRQIRRVVASRGPGECPQWPISILKMASVALNGAIFYRCSMTTEQIADKNVSALVVRCRGQSNESDYLVRQRLMSQKGSGPVCGGTAASSPTLTSSKRRAIQVGTNTVNRVRKSKSSRHSPALRCLQRCIPPRPEPLASRPPNAEQVDADRRGSRPA